LELEDIQTGIITADFASEHVYGTDLLLQLCGNDVAARQRSLGELRTVCENAPTGCRVTIGLTAGALTRLGVAAGLVAQLPPEFVFGAATRREQLGDRTSDDRLDPVTRKLELDVIVMIASCVEANVDEVKLDIVASMSDDNLLGELTTYLRSDRKEHFGFRDGFSNPPLEGSGFVGPPHNGVKTPHGWRSVRAGEIVFGYPNEAGVLPGPRIAHDLLRNGSFLVWRKIEQHCDRFEELQSKLATRTGACPQAAAARIIGRNTDGSTLIAAVRPGGENENNFDYTEDNADAEVPLQSHVRRSNPRATPGFSDPRAGVPLSDKVAVPLLTYGGFHRILRRSMLWEEGELKGTIFRCYQTNIADQFEFIQRNWLNDGGSFREGRAIDPVGGSVNPEPVVGSTIASTINDPRAHERSRMAYPNEDISFENLTTPLATLYAFVPGKRAMAALAAGTFGEQ
jgi:deferrochelatase/peroxidase EfeB